MGSDELSAKITLDESGFTLGVDNIVAALEKLDNSAGKVSADLAKKLGQPLETLSLDTVANRLEKASATLGGALNSVVAPATAFDASMRNVNTIAKLSEEQLAAFAEQVRTLGGELSIGVSPTEGAAAAYDILSAGIEGTANVQEVLRQSLVAARAGLTDTATAADAITTVLNSYGLQAQDAGKVSDVLFKTVERGKVTFEELARQIGDVTPIAAQNGISLEQLGAAFATLTVKGTKAPQAATALRAAIAALAAPTDEAKKAAAEYGLTLDTNTLKSRGLVGALNDVFTATGGNQAAIRKILGDLNALSAALNLASDGGKKFAFELQQAANSSGAAQAALGQQQKSFAAAQERVTASFEAFKTKAGQAFLPTLGLMATGAESAVKVLEIIPGPVLAIAGAAGVLATGLATAVAGIISFQATLLGAQKVMASTTFGSALLSKGLGGALSGAFGALSGNMQIFIGVLGAVGAGMAAGKLIVEAYTAAMNFLNAEAIETAATLSRLEGSLAGAAAANADAISQSAQEIVNAAGTAEEATRKIGAELGAQRNLRQKFLDAGDSRGVAAVDQVIKELEAKRAAIESGAVRAQKQVGAQQMFLSGERLKEALHVAEIESKNDQDHLQRLEQILSQTRAGGEERRGIETTIFHLKEKIAKADEAATKKSNQDRFEQAKQDIDLSDKTTAEKIKALQKLAKIYADDGDKRRAIEKDIAKLQEQLAKEEEDRIKRLSDLRASAADQAQSASEQRVEGLERDRSRGVDTADQIAEEFKRQGEAEKKAIQDQLDKKLADPKNKPFEVELKRQAEVAKGQVDTRTAQRIQDLEDRDAQDRATRAVEQLDAEKAIGQARLGALRQQVSTSQNLEGLGRQLEQELVAQLKLEEEKIRVQADAAKAATDNVTRQRQIELEAQAAIAQARQAAGDEILRSNQLIDEQIKKTRQLKGESGPIKGAQKGQFAFTMGTVGGVAETFGDDAQKAAAERDAAALSPFAARQAATKAANDQRRIRAMTGAGTPQDLLNVLGTPIERKVTPFAPPGPATAAKAPPAEVDITVKIDGQIKGPDGRPVGGDPAITVDGRGSTVARRARVMSTRGLGGG